MPVRRNRVSRGRQLLFESFRDSVEPDLCGILERGQLLVSGIQRLLLLVQSLVRLLGVDEGAFRCCNGARFLLASFNLFPERLPETLRVSVACGQKLGVLLDSLLERDNDVIRVLFSPRDQTPHPRPQRITLHADLFKDAQNVPQGPLTLLHKTCNEAAEPGHVLPVRFRSLGNRDCQDLIALGACRRQQGCLLFIQHLLLAEHVLQHLDRRIGRLDLLLALLQRPLQHVDHCRVLCGLLRRLLRSPRVCSLVRVHGVGKVFEAPPAAGRRSLVRHLYSVHHRLCRRHVIGVLEHLLLAIQHALQLYLFV